MENSKAIKEFLDVMDKAKDRYNNAYEMVGELDKSTQDIMHKLELDNLSYKENCKLMTRLKTVRKDRRYYKDIVEIYQPIIDYKSENERSVNLLKHLLGEVRKVEKYHKKRTYVPRVLKG